MLIHAMLFQILTKIFHQSYTTVVYNIIVRVSNLCSVPVMTYRYMSKTLKVQIFRFENINISFLVKTAMELQDIYSGCTLLVTSNGRTCGCKDRVPSIENWTNSFFLFNKTLPFKKQVKCYSKLR